MCLCNINYKSENDLNYYSIGEFNYHYDVPIFPHI